MLMSHIFNRITKDIGIEIFKELPKNTSYSVIICAVAHDKVIEVDKNEWLKLLAKNGFIYDIKSCLPEEIVDFKL